MPVSSLIVGRIVDFDVDANASLYELLAVDGYGRQRRVGHLSRDAGALYVADLFADQPHGTLDPPRRYESPSRYVALAWTRRRLRKHEIDARAVQRRKCHIEPRPHGAPFTPVDEPDRGATTYRMPPGMRIAAMG